MIILGIDPGAHESGWVDWDADDSKLLGCGITDNPYLRGVIRGGSRFYILAIEQIRGYGIVAGDDTFGTCEWTGRFAEAHEGKVGGPGTVVLIPRKDIKRHLCGNTTTNDKYVRQALIDRFGDVGTKKKPGPLFGISGHMWSALAVCVVCADRIKEV